MAKEESGFIEFVEFCCLCCLFFVSVPAATCDVQKDASIREYVVYKSLICAKGPRTEEMLKMHIPKQQKSSNLRTNSYSH